jgi:hypothetical protein
MPITVPYKKVVDSKNDKKTIFVFDKIYEYMDFISQVEPTITGRAKDVYDRNVTDAIVTRDARERKWFGTTDPNEVKGDLNEYLFIDDLNRFLDEFRNSTVNFDSIDIDQKKKIVFTSQEIGIFSFDLASVGLVRVYEYYSPLLQKIVNPNFVKSYKGDDGSIIFYHVEVKEVPAHKVEKKGSSYYSEKLKREVEPSKVYIEENNGVIDFYYPTIEAIPQHDLVRKQQVSKDGKPKFASTFKKSFIHIPKINNRLPRIDIIVSAAYPSGINAVTQMLWSSMAAITVAEKLSKSGVDFRIFAAYAKELDNKKELYTFVKLKDTFEPLNINGLAIMTSDARMYRYKLFKGTITAAFDAGYGNDLPMGISYPINDNNMIKSAFMEYLRQTKDYDTDDERVIESSKIIFTRALSRDEAMQQYNNTVRQISNVSQNLS